MDIPDDSKIPVGADGPEADRGTSPHSGGRTGLLLKPGGFSSADGSLRAGRFGPDGTSTDLILQPGDRELAAWLEGIVESRIYECLVEDVGGRTLLRRVFDEPRPATSRSPAPDLSMVHDSAIRGPSTFAASFREYAEDALWPRWYATAGENPPPPGTAASSGMCRLTAACMAAVLAEIDPSGGWKAVGGHPSLAYLELAKGQFSARFRGMDGGLWNLVSGGWDGHYWVVGRHGGDDVLVDVAGDQYGWDPVVVASVVDPRYRANYKASTVGKDMGGPMTKKLVAEAVDTWAGRSLEADATPPAPR